MIKSTKKYFYLFFLMLLLTACSTTSIDRNVHGKIPGKNGEFLSLDQVKTAVEEACKQRGWRVKEDNDQGSMILTYDEDGYKVEVYFSYLTNYAISYKDSSNMEYNGTDINRNYNNWINNLKESINYFLSQQQQSSVK